MNALGEAATDLCWLAPSRATLLALACNPASIHSLSFRRDPGAVLLLYRFGATRILETALRFSQETQPRTVPWHRPDLAQGLRAAVLQAHLAEAIAARVEGVDAEKAWGAGLLSGMGFFAVGAVNSASLPNGNRCDRPGASVDYISITRRLGRSWELPRWLTSIIGNLGFHADHASQLGAERKLFCVVSLAVELTRQGDLPLGLEVGTSVAELLLELKLDEAETQRLLRQARREADDFEIERETPGDYSVREFVELKRVLDDQGRGEEERLREKKLAALGELAAGAGHEINNPLAVIQGQAQYALKQLQQFGGLLLEEPELAGLLEPIKDKVERSLQTVVGQVQRIHGVLTDLMQFARPSVPKPQAVPVRGLIQDAVASLGSLIQSKKIQIVHPESTAEKYLDADPQQAKSALTSLIRNAVEAAPVEGWVRIRVESPEGKPLRLIVEDNGPGLSPLAREHLFDPFFSGRPAGRGKGFGLCTAWRFARQHRGDVAFEFEPGITRFVLSWPEAPAVPETIDAGMICV